MSAPFIPPTADLGVTAVPGANASVVLGGSAPAPEPEAHTIPAVPGEPRPVAPAEDIGVPPAKALDPVAEQSILDKAREVTKPYISKIQETTKPYVDAAEQKAEQLFAKLDSAGGLAQPETTGAVPTDTTAPYAAGPGAKSAPGESGVEEFGNKAIHMFEQGLATVSSTFTKVTHTIDEKTKSDTHPGVITQATSAFNQGVHKVDGFLNEKLDGTSAAAPQPVQTTTNTVPHPEAGNAAPVPPTDSTKPVL